jgi:hypothetical protein
MKRLGLFALFLIIESALPHVFAAEKRFSLPTEGSPLIGPKRAAVTIVEFIDYQ